MPRPKPTPQPKTRQCRGCLTQQLAHFLNHLRVCQKCRDVIRNNPRAVAIRESLRRRREAQS